MLLSNAYCVRLFFFGSRRTAGKRPGASLYSGAREATKRLMARLSRRSM